MEQKRRTSLVIMAAGIGSRFGKGIKQLTPFGPGGEIIMDYSIYDALAAGFDKVVFILRKDIADDFRQVIGRRIEDRAEVAYAYQEKEDLPEGFSFPQGRVKPWGTGQAILAARDVISDPFCVINADDYYGKEAFCKIHDYLIHVPERASVHQPYRICMAGFLLRNTLSEYGGVTRGVCRVDEAGRLDQIVETRNIIRHGGGAAVAYPDGTLKVLDPETPVSMNMWGLQPDFVDRLKEGFPHFLEDHIGQEDEKTCEYLLPTIIGDLLDRQQALIDVLPIRDKWFGVTYQEDIPSVRDSFRQLTDQGLYPERLWT